MQTVSTHTLMVSTPSGLTRFKGHARHAQEPMPSVSAPRFGYSGGGLLGGIQQLMSAIEANKILELTITDVLAMVFPRTTIEAVKRGTDPARETFFREITGTVTNTYLAGWLGAAAVGIFASRHYNPKGMNFKAWVDSGALESFSGIAREVVTDTSITSPKAMREKFIHTVLSRIKSTDPIVHLPEYQQYFPGQGKLVDRATDKPLSKLVDMFMGRPLRASGKHEHHAYNVEKLTHWRQSLGQNKQEIQNALEAIEEKFMAARGYAPLSKSDQRTLSLLKSQNRFRLLGEQAVKLRKIETGAIRAAEKTFLENATQYAIEHGQLSNEVVLLDKAGKPVKAMGKRSIDDMLKRLKYFSEEFFHRALANPTTGEIGEEAITSGGRQAILGRLFGKSGNTWWRRNVLPNRLDGLVDYAYKSKNLRVMLPIAVTIAVGCSMVFVNNWLTRRKHGGKDFFPGETVLMQKSRGGLA